MAAVSARSAWAVGQTDGDTNPTKTLILRWNGTTWTQVPSPSPGADSSLSGVAAAPPATPGRSAPTSTLRRSKTLILRWNGKTWK